MATARDIMTGGAECAQTTDTVQQAAQKMRTSASALCRSAARTTGSRA